jgi:outer membrane protein TolC
VATVPLDLAACLALGHQHHPRIAARRASLAAAQAGLRAVERLPNAPLLAPELPIRRRQAALGVAVMAAGLDQALHETTYAVTSAYLRVLHARDQERVARGVVDRLTTTRDLAKRALDAGVREVTAADVHRASVSLHLAGLRRIQAAQGVKRALAALREAIGVHPQTCLRVREDGLPEAESCPCREEVVAWALSRRPELVRAALFAEIVCLECEAQAATAERRMATFASVVDIHGSPLPRHDGDGEYRPGAMPPEMPAFLAGCRQDRVNRAHAFHARARAVMELTRNLVALEADDAFLRWEQAALQTKEAREAVQAGESLARELSKDLTALSKTRVEEVVNAWVLTAQAQAQYNEARYQQLLALADLERVTGGAFCARLVERNAAAAPPAEAEAIPAR